MNNNDSVNAMYVATNGTMTGNLGVTTATSGGTTGISTNAVYHYNGTGWDYWTNYYYPQVIRESYPVYLKERAEDKGKQAFEIIKSMQDKKLMKLDKVSDFIDAMDILIKIL